MKKGFLSLLLCLPFAVAAQTDSKYLAGAVTLDDGRVSFKMEIQVPSLTKAQLYDTALEWANKRFQPESPFNARVLYTNEDEGSIAIGGEEWLVFTASALSLDRTRIYYQLFITCEEGRCSVDMTRIRYLYDGTRNGGDRYTAEEWIVDDIALNKSKTKLSPVCGKFRKRTIDLKDELFKDIQETIGNLIHPNTRQETVPIVTETTVQREIPIVTEVTISEETPIVTEVTVPEETPIITEVSPVHPETPAIVPPVEATTVEPPATEAQIDAATRLTITIGNGEPFDIGKKCWGGFGQLFGKDVTFCFINTQEAECNLALAETDSYRLTFYAEGSTVPSAVIRCKKLMQQTLNGEEAQKMNPNTDEGKSYYMYVGEMIR